MRNPLRRLSGGSLVLLAWSASCFGVGTGTVPFELLDGHLVVVRGGIGELDDLRMVIDTGAGATVISRGVAKRLRLKGTPESVRAFGQRIQVRRVILPWIRLASWGVEKTPALVQKLSGLADGKIDVVVGIDLLRETPLTIDYSTQRISLGSADSKASWMAFYPGLPFVPLNVTVGDRSLRLKLDTGTGDLILYKKRVEGKVQLRPRKQVQHRTVLGGGSIQLVAVGIPALLLGGSCWSNVEALLRDDDTGLNVAGNLGPLALGLSRVVIDFENGRFGWVAEGPSPEACRPQMAADPGAKP